MAAALLSSLATGRSSPSTRLFLSRNRPHSSNPLVRINPFPFLGNPSRRISCSSADPQLSAPRRVPPRLGINSTLPDLLQLEIPVPAVPAARRQKKENPTKVRRGKKQQKISKYENLWWDMQRTQIDKKFLHAAAMDQHTPAAIVSCATIKDDEEMDHVTLQFSTSDSDGVLLKQFSIPLILRKPFVMSACQNLLLLMDQDVSFLCNIATQELVTFPYIDDTYPLVTGIGYVPSTKEFKALSGFGLDFKALTLGAHQWRDVENPPLDIHRYKGAFVNGAIHVLAGYGDKIATFNLETEKWGSITAPPTTITKWISPSLKELSGYLCMFDEGQHSIIDIWLLKDSWVKECTINLSYWVDLISFRPLAIEPDGRILVQVHMVDKFGGQVFSLQFYDPKTNSSQETHRFLFDKFVDCRKFYAKVFSSLWHR